MKKNIMSATLLLAIGGFICKALGAIYKIPLSNILGSEGIGLYQLIFPFYSFALIFVSGGLPLAISKFTSRALAKRDYKSISAYFYGALLFSLVFGLFFALVFFVFGKSIANFQNAPMLHYGYYIVAISVIFGGVISCYRGLFQGYGNMNPTFYSSLIEQIFKLALGLLLAYYFSVYNVYLAVFGALAAIALSEIITLLYLFLHALVAKKKKKIALQFVSFEDKANKSEAKSMLVYSVPITLSSLLLPLTFMMQSLFSITLLVNYGHSQTYATSLFGIQTGMVNSIINFPSVISVAFAVTIVPSLTYYLTKKDKHNVKKLIASIYRIIWILILPCTVGIFVLSEPIMRFAFSFALDENMINIASLLMRISSFSILFISITQISTVLLQTTGQQWKAFVSLFMFFVLNIFFAIHYIQKFSIIGLGLANLITYAFSSVLNMIFLSKKYSPSLLLKDILIPFISSVLMGIIVYYLFYYLPFNSLFIKLIICVFIAIIFYFFILFLFRVIHFKKLPITRKYMQK